MVYQQFYKIIAMIFSNTHTLLNHCSRYINLISMILGYGDKIDFFFQPATWSVKYRDYVRFEIFEP
jgi:hypothetical protein